MCKKMLYTFYKIMCKTNKEKKKEYDRARRAKKNQSTIDSRADI